MKKFIFILLVILIIIGIFFAFRSCEPRVKPVENTTSEDVSNETVTTTEVIEEDLEIYRTPFIDANTEFTCQLIADETILEDDALFKENLDAAYKKYDFPIDDNQKMIKILDKYENDEEVINAIKENVKKCQK